MPLLLVCGAWAIVAATHLFGLWIANLWGFWLVVYALAWLAGIALAATGVAVLWVTRGAGWAVPALVLSMLAAAAIVAVD